MTSETHCETRDRYLGTMHHAQMSQHRICRPRSSGYRWNPIWVAVWMVALSLLARNGAAHDLTMDQLLLLPDVGHGTMIGQLTFNPHATRAVADPSTPEIQQKVLATVAAAIKVEVDKKPLKLKLEVRELWARGAPATGDTIMINAALPRNARELRVFADSPVNALIVTVEVAAATGTSRSQSVMVQGGNYTPPYHFQQGPSEWKSGGPGVFESEMVQRFEASRLQKQAASRGSLPITPSAKPDNSVQSASNSGGFEEVSPLAQMRRYLSLGFRHILPLGWDHVLFVAGLVLGSGLRLRRLLWQLSAFTLAHTMTLALGALGWVVLSRAVVEPLIAFSIAYVALENLVLKYNERRRVLLAFVFGLLHGQGFASSLLNTGLPRGAFLLALVSFNAGVELGQLVTVLALCVVLRMLQKRASFRLYAVRVGSAAIAIAGLGWGFVRLLG